MKNNTEIWATVKGYEGIYEVSTFGNVRSVDRKIECSNGRVSVLKGKIISTSCNPDNGYVYVMLYKGGTMKKHYVHRLVATAFIPNPDNLPDVDHINEDVTNNTLENLQWLSHKDNCNKGNRNKKISEARKKPINAYDAETGEYIGTFSSISKASEILGIYAQGISKVINGKAESAGGVYFEVADKEGTVKLAKPKKFTQMNIFEFLA